MCCIPAFTNHNLLSPGLFSFNDCDHFLCFFSLFDLKLEEAKQLVRDAITAGIFCDLGSGSNVDLCVITDARVEFLRGYDRPAMKGKR